VQHVILALDLASAALAEGKPIPSEANRLISQTPIRFMPFSMCRWIFMKMARQNWDEQASANQVSKEDVLVKPYVNIETTNVSGG
jgi:hypothetical protein